MLARQDATSWPGSAGLLNTIRAPSWLQTPYGASLLRADFGSGFVLELNFDVLLPDGTSLATAAAKVLRHEVYDFICLQGHPLARGRKNRSPKTEREHVLAAVNVVDYFLLRAKETNLAQHGFAAIGTQNIHEFLLEVGSHRTGEEGIYGWSKRLGEFLKRQLTELDEEQTAETLRQHPELSIHIPTTPCLKLGMTPEQIIGARVFLKRSGLYRVLDKTAGPYTAGPNSRLLAASIYSNTLVGRSGLGNWSRHSELCWGRRGASQIRELDGVTVWAGRVDERCSKKRVSDLTEKILSWRHLSWHGVGIRKEVLEGLEVENIHSVLSLKDVDGVTFVPPPIVAGALRSAIDFVYDHGAHIVESLRAVLKEAERRGAKPPQFGNGNQFCKLLTEQTRALGVVAWSTTDYLKSTLGRSPTAEELAHHIRTDRPGLLECVRILHGASLICVGALQAARQGEVLDLTWDALDESEQWLGLISRKTGFNPLRTRDFRPAPPVVVDVLKLLGGFAKSLDKSERRIFQMLTYDGALSVSGSLANEALDMFCDFAEVGLDSQGARYYLRLHQLRKFFASAFFHCCGFAGLEPLRWFLRHLDLEQVWAYLKASIPGAAMRHYKSTAVALTIRDGASDLAKLTNLLLSRFGVTSFDVVGDAELVELLDEVQFDGSVEIEPVFGTVDGESAVRLGVLVWGDS